MVKRISEENQKLCLRMMKVEFADLHLSGNYSIRKLNQRKGLNVYQKMMSNTTRRSGKCTYTGNFSKP